MIDKRKKTYTQQKGNSWYRGIEFDFTFAEWCAWWERQLGPNWMQMRGCRRGQYVMARAGDEGPYAAWNVKCILSSANHKERNKQLWMSRYAKRTQKIAHRPWYESRR